MPLFTVELRTVVVIQARGPADARLKAWRSHDEICRDTDIEIEAGREIKSLSDLPAGWDGMCLPYGGDGNTRLKDLLDGEER